MKKQLSAFVLSGLISALFLVGCGDKSSAPSTASNEPASNAPAAAAASIAIDGSTTVFPIVSTVAEDFKAENANISPTVSKAGTGSGFKKFIDGELDIVTASRPVKGDELKKLEEKKIEFVEIPVAYDGVSVIVNPGNTWAKNVTKDELKAAWAKGSKVATWNEINPAFPKEKITFYGPTDNHGTYEYFTEAINGKKNEIREAYQPNQEYTAIVTAVAGDKSAMAFVGFNYYLENKDKVSALTVGGVAPTDETIVNGTYTPLSRPLFIYVKKSSMANESVKKFVDFVLGEKGQAAVTENSFVKLPADVLEAVKAHVAAGEVGTKMKDFKPGMKLTDRYGKK